MDSGDVGIVVHSPSVIKYVERENRKHLWRRCHAGCSEAPGVEGGLSSTEWEDFPPNV